MIENVLPTAAGAAGTAAVGAAAGVGKGMKPAKEGARQLPARPTAPPPLERSGSSAAIERVVGTAGTTSLPPFKT